MRRPEVRSLLFVCMGNICRSPMAEGILRVRAEERGLKLLIDSAGTEAYHVGEPPDPRARRVSMGAGTPIDAQRARQVQARDFERFDLILAADRRNLNALQMLRPATARAELGLLLQWAGHGEGLEVPDPYYGRLEDFEAVHRLLDSACRGIAARIAGVAECESIGGAWD